MNVPESLYGGKRQPMEPFPDERGILIEQEVRPHVLSGFDIESDCVARLVPHHFHVCLVIEPSHKAG